LETAPTLEQQIHWLGILKSIRTGWTLEQRRQLLGWWQKPRSSRAHPPEVYPWFSDVGRTYSEGAQLYLKLDSWREAIINQLTDGERSELASLLTPPPAADAPPAPTPREFVRHWTLAEFSSALGRPAGARNFDRGRTAFIDAQCAQCHRIENFGGAVGPELMGAGAKYTPRDLLESILEPSKVVSEQYQDTTVTLTDGEELTGRIASEDTDLLVLVANPLKPVEHRIPKSRITRRLPAMLSPMPEGLVDILTREEILDLIAYVRSGAHRQSAEFR
jgi:putative heme-binding domain-containing protein